MPAKPKKELAVVMVHSIEINKQEYLFSPLPHRHTHTVMRVILFFLFAFAFAAKGKGEKVGATKDELGSLPNNYHFALDPSVHLPGMTVSIIDFNGDGM